MFVFKYFSVCACVHVRPCSYIHVHVRKSEEVLDHMDLELQRGVSYSMRMLGTELGALLPEKCKFLTEPSVHPHDTVFVY